MGPSELLDNLTAEQVEGIDVIELSYRDTDAQRAQRIANAVAAVASEQISQETPYDYYVLQIQVWQEARLPSTPVSFNPVRNAMVALGLGVMVGIGLALLMEQRAT
jgi:non-specific protein-tyrosine kinase